MNIRLNTSTDYAVLIMLYLAEKKKTISSAELAENISVSKRYLIQIADKLRDGGLIRVSMGSTGGYSLVKKLDEVSIYDIIVVMEGPMEILKCTEKSVKNYSVLYETYYDLENHISGYLKALTLDALLSKTSSELCETAVRMADGNALRLRTVSC